MKKSSVPLDEPALALKEWFLEVLRGCDSIFDIPGTPSHKEAAIQTVLTMNAKVLVGSSIDADGALYAPLCKMLAAASRKLQVEINLQNWKAAVENVLTT